ncbi:hypothetical protein [Nesterenkonia flava]|uniref:Transcriptional regulator, AbiEi antitoxin, Type IV TA system n=1 Tax=Nesterenkonia flava TaxID=469799 RepID=A0ABU1FQJ0_9MICC|nr:hypothetical protein [Nesterenkonia flava]MDR5710904.1 hypothetical protein [Nesterenkonia flava]
MSPAPPASAAAARSLNLLRPGQQPHRRNLEKRTRSGELLRLRRGIYIDAAAFLSASPDQRHRAESAAVALTKEHAVFCRETALALHGVPLLAAPGAVHVRTFRASRAGRQCHSQADLPESSDAARDLLQRTGLTPGQARHRLSGLEVRRILPPMPAGYTRAQAAAAYREGALILPRTALPAAAFTGFTAEPHLAEVEDLPFTLSDTVPRMGMPAAVVVLDAVLRGFGPEKRRYTRESLLAWSTILPSTSLQKRWQELLAFADENSESPGESWSRVLLHQCGFPAPVLQQRFTLSTGRRVRTDFFWPERGLVGEFDGRMKYTRARQLSGDDAGEVVFQEKRREETLAELGLRTVRWVWDDLRDPARMVERLSRAGLPRRR